MERFLADGTGTNIDQAHLLECRAACEKDHAKAVQLTQDALRLLGDITKENAHFASNLHSNLGALYHKQMKYDLAQMHMEQGIDLLEAYGLTGCHDSIMQINNYAVLLTDMGEAQRGYSAVMKLGRKVRELNSDKCLDYGLIQQTLGGISLAQGNVQQRKQLTAEKNAVPIWNLVRKHHLSQQLAQVMEELEELRSEKAAILARFDRTEDKEMKEVKIWAKQQEKTVQDLKAKETHCEEEYDSALGEYQKLSEKGKCFDQNELWAERLKHRDVKTQAAKEKMQGHFGKPSALI